MKSTYQQQHEERQRQRREAEQRRWQTRAKIRAFDEAVALEAERQREFEAKRRRSRAQLANFAFEHPELCRPKPKPKPTSAQSSTDRTPPWGCRERLMDGSYRWHRVPSGSQADAEKLATSLRRDGRQVEATPMGGTRRSLTRIYGGPDAAGLR